MYRFLRKTLKQWIVRYQLLFPCQSLKYLLFVSNQVTQYLLVRSFSYRHLIWQKKVNILRLLRGKYCLIHLEIENIPKNWNYSVEILSKTRVSSTPTQLNLFELDFNVKFPLLRLLHFLTDLKSTIINFPISCGS